MVGIIISMLFWQSIYASPVRYEKKQIREWKNHQNCHLTDTCSLKTVRVSTQSWRADYSNKFGAGAYNYGDTMTLSFETKDVASLEKFAVVQYVKGCVYRNFVRDGKVRTFFLDARFSHNATLKEASSVWIQKDWVIDSDDLDPVYNSPFSSDLESMKYPSRLGLYRWNENANFDKHEEATSNAKESEKYFGDNYPPQTPKLYVTDRPGTAFLELQNVDNQEVLAAKNISLDFRACIYKASDVPANIKDLGDKVFIDNPITCFDWSSRHVYNWQKKVYEKPVAMSEECIKYDL